MAQPRSRSAEPDLVRAPGADQDAVQQDGMAGTASAEDRQGGGDPAPFDLDDLLDTEPGPACSVDGTCD